MKKLLTIIVATMLLVSCQDKQETWTLNSPDGKIRVTLDMNQNKQLRYQVSLWQDGAFHALTDPSDLGIIREDGRFSENLEFENMLLKEGEQDSYSLVSGKRQHNEVSWNELQLSLSNLEDQLMELHFRAYDHGIAFRYHFPGSSEKNMRVVEERSAFNFMDGNFWAHPYDTLSQWTPAYETFYQGPLAVGSDAPWNKNGWAFPILVESEGAWILVSEAGFDGSYGASHLDPDCSEGNYRIRFAEAGEAEGFYDPTSHASLPWSLPWRFMAIGKTPATVLETSLPTDLSMDSKVEDISWIRPGRASWSWWSLSDSPQDYNQLVPFVDLAATMGWEYSLVDANWNRMKNGNLEKLAAYAASKDVGLLVWYNSGGKHNVVPEEPRDLMFERSIRRQEFEKLKAMGIKGIKVDFFQSDKQTIINQYIGILEDAAEFHLLVNFHGCTLPKGWRRTYPNLLSMESVRGGECYKFDARYPEMAPAHLSIVPFTRNAVGPCDYTPGGFSHHTYPHLTTYGFELALPVIIESGIMHHMDTPEQTLGLPAFAVEFLKNIPVVWDETRYISGYPGKDVVIARRQGEQWYIGGINGEPYAKELSLDLNKLGSLPQRIMLMTDGDSASDLIRSEITPVDGKITMHMKPYGGFVGVW